MQGLSFYLKVKKVYWTENIEVNVIIVSSYMRMKLSSWISDFLDPWSLILSYNFVHSL